MSDIAIQVSGIGKQYHIGGVQKIHDTLGEQMADTLLSPFRRAGKILRGQATGAAELDEQFWALRDINFEVQRGEVIGIIGRNGAGKSTLLKILSRITEPTEGFVELRGRVGSLLEVGTGFHPELTGRENVFLNGAILGMRRAEIVKKFDEIVAFAEIDKFIDTPVKHYSSGMYVRLAFSVAAHLEPEILLVDEVLAVGDVAFQKKCMGKMDNVSREGRTILFVSHNMNAMQRLCPRSILLHKGQLAAEGLTADIVARYLSSSSDTAQPNQWIGLSGATRSGSGRVQFTAVAYSSQNEALQNQPYSNGPLQITLDVFSDAPRTIGSLATTLYDQYGTKLVNADTLALGQEIELQYGRNKVTIQIDNLYLNPGIYVLGLWAASPPSEVYDEISAATRLEVVEPRADKISIQADGAVTCDFGLVATSLSVV